MMVQVGFWQRADEALPSTTKRFFTSCDCWNWFRTDFFGSLPMRAVPSSWIDQPSVSTRLADVHDLEAGGLEHFLGGLRHVRGHLVFVVAELVVEAKRRNAPLVFHHGIEIDISFRSGPELRRSRPC